MRLFWKKTCKDFFVMFSGKFISFTETAITSESFDTQDNILQACVARNTKQGNRAFLEMTPRIDMVLTKILMCSTLKTFIHCTKGLWLKELSQIISQNKKSLV